MQMKRRELLSYGLATAGAAGMGIAGARYANASCAASPTPPQILGPFPPRDFAPDYAPPHFAVAENDMDLTQVKGRPAKASGQVVAVQGRVLRDCKPAVGAEVMIWQADKDGHYNHQAEQVTAAELDPNFGFWGSTTVGDDGRFTLKTIIPGAYAAAGARGKGMRPPHFHWMVVHKGAQLVTQTYFEGDELPGISEIRRLNERDAILRFKMGFERLATGDLTRTRQVAEEQLIVRFQPGDEAPTGQLTFHLA